MYFFFNHFFRIPNAFDKLRKCSISSFEYLLPIYRCVCLIPPIAIRKDFCVQHPPYGCNPSDCPFCALLYSRLMFLFFLIFTRMTIYSIHRLHIRFTFIDSNYPYRRFDFFAVFFLGREKKRN